MWAHLGMPVEEWLDTFLPICGGSEQKLSRNSIDFKAVPPDNKGGESAFVRVQFLCSRYLSLTFSCVKATAIRAAGICGDDVFPVDTHRANAKDKFSSTLSSPDFCLLSKNITDLTKPQKAIMWHLTALFGDLKSAKFLDPCQFSKPDLKPEDNQDPRKLGSESNFDESYDQGSEAAQACRGQLASYAHYIFQNGHRTHVFAFVVMPETARLLRFDHSGVIYSNEFYWRGPANPHLAEFFRRFGKASPAERGLDTSVEWLKPGAPEITLARSILENWTELPEGYEKGSIIPHIINDDDIPLALVHVFDDEARQFHRVVTHRPKIESQYLISRATRGYVVVDLDARIVGYMKDSWRVSFSDLPTESKTYRRLTLYQVENYLPDFYYGGDVPLDAARLWKMQDTAGDSKWRAPEKLEMQHTEITYERCRKHYGNKVVAQPHRHHRLLFKKIGRPLTAFKSTRGLATAVYHALQGTSSSDEGFMSDGISFELAHTEACDTAGIIHRDISINNILIDRTGNGMLIDWDLCKWTKGSLVRDESRKSRTVRRLHSICVRFVAYAKQGTLQFMAVPLVDQKNVPHTRRFDLESFVYVLFYVALRYTTAFARSDESQKKLLEDMRLLYFSPNGLQKASFMRDTGVFTNSELKSNLRPLSASLYGLLVTVRNLFKPVYPAIPIQPDALDKAVGVSMDVGRDKILVEQTAAEAALDNSAAEMLQVFKYCIFETKFWPENDASADLLPVGFQNKVSPKLPAAYDRSSLAKISAERSNGSKRSRTENAVADDSRAKKMRQDGGQDQGKDQD